MSHGNAGFFSPKPLDVRFESVVDLTLHNAFLPSAGLLQCDPTAKIELVTVRRMIGTSGPSFCISSKLLSESTVKIFTSSPKFEETFHFTVSDASSFTTTGGGGNISGVPPGVEGCGPTDEVETLLVMTLEDSTSRKFLGQATCPLSPCSPSMTPPSSPVRVMLQPRNLGKDPSDPLFLEDKATLLEKGIDDFGYVTISWKVALIPLGGAMDVVVDPIMIAADPSLAEPITLPIGLTIKATWLLTQDGDAEVDTQRANNALQYSLSVGFGDGKRFFFSDGKPLFLTLHAASQLQALIFSCSAHNMYQPDLSREIAVIIPVPPLTAVTSVDRDIHWVAPVRSLWGEDFGILATTVRLSRHPLEGGIPACPTNAICLLMNDPKHQEEFSHVAPDFSRAPPHTPLGAYQMIFWESEEHIRAALERRRQRDVVVGAKPTEEHIRHLFDVLMRRSILDENVAKVACTFFQCAGPSELVALQLKKLMVSFAFHCDGLTAVEAARFLFFAFRSDVEDAVAVEEFHFMMQHSLLEKTLDMPENEMRRWVTDLVGRSVKVLRYKEFVTYVLRNFSFWYSLGVPLQMNRASSSTPLSHLSPQKNQKQSSSTWSSCFLLQEVSLHGGGGGRASASNPSSLSCSGSSRSVRSTGSPPQQSFGAALVASSDNSASVPGSSSGRKISFSEGGKSVQFQEAAKENRDASHFATSANASPWRSFVVRVGGPSPKAFTVTAHAEDKIRAVMKMVEGSTGIKAECQQWKLNNEVVLSPLSPISSTTLGIEPSLKSNKHSGVSPLAPEVWISEQEENVLIRFFFKEKNKHWQQRFPIKEKVLQVRASVQRQTLIPLSRCMLRLVRSGKSLVLQDRHTLAHYSPESNDIIEVTQEVH